LKIGGRTQDVRKDKFIVGNLSVKSNNLVTLWSKTESVLLIMSVCLGYLAMLSPVDHLAKSGWVIDEK
jgi:hypothetical protein